MGRDKDVACGTPRCPGQGRGNRLHSRRAASNQGIADRSQSSRRYSIFRADQDDERGGLPGGDIRAEEVAQGDGRYARQFRRRLGSASHLISCRVKKTTRKSLSGLGKVSTKASPP